MSGSQMVGQPMMFLILNEYKTVFFHSKGPNPLRYVVTGTSGFVGRMLIPLLINRGSKVLLIGRNTEDLRRLFPSAQVSGYQNADQIITSGDVVVNLAVINNNQNVSINNMRDVNVHLAHRLATISAKVGAAHFVNISSIHAINPFPKSAYAITKKEAIDKINSIPGLTVTHLILPSIYGTRFAGKLKLLNSCPTFISSLFFNILKTLKPTLKIETLADWLLNVSNQGKTTTILTDTQNNNFIFHLFKRSIDILFCGFVVIFLGWLMVLIAVSIRLTSPGPALFKHKRVGQNGVIFTCLKFRSMKIDTLELGTHEVNREAITVIGKIIRRTKIDELPQIWNILANHMTLIGPRPCLPTQTQLLKLRQRAAINCLKPGISGLAQINNVDMSNPALLVEWDLQYLKLQSLSLDFQIALKTAIGTGQGDPAQRS